LCFVFFFEKKNRLKKRKNLFPHKSKKKKSFNFSFTRKKKKKKKPWAPAHKVGDIISLEIQEKYLENWDQFPNSKVYAPDTDRMKSSYEYYIFDKAAFEAAGSPSNIRVVIEAVNSTAEHAASGSAEPEGGFKNKYYTCAIVDGADSEEASSSATSEEDNE
jgi:hypothetical protein